MTVDLTGKSFRFFGSKSAISDAVETALVANGARMTTGHGDILIVAYPLLPEVDTDLIKLTEDARVMAEHQGGRIVVLLSAVAVVPMRRHVDYSATMSAAYAHVRGLAMQFGPSVLINAIGCGLIEDDRGMQLAGDTHMLTHVPLGHAGSCEDISDAVLFLSDPQNSYTTGQILVVDGGWSPGYGRNF
ncbi:MAG: SDR family oxidoreductase [Rhizobiaceae bacterium]|nr:SDR family oxidoreductase [Rhizobiaceae bacterium]